MDCLEEDTANNNDTDISDESMSKGDKSKLTTKEELSHGNVNWRVYFELLKAYGISYALITVLFELGFHSTYNISFLWLAHWNDDHKLANFTLLAADSSARHDRNQFYATICVVLGIVQTLCCITYSALMQFRHVNSSRVIHAQLLESIMHAPMSFFDITPKGRILNRFSQDLDVLDSEIYLQIEIYIEHALFTVGMLCVISYTFPVFVAILVPTVILFFFIQKVYVNTSCQLQRLASNNRSPVFAHFSETLSGASVIRAHKHQDRFIADSETKVDNFQKAMSITYASIKWVQLRLDLITCVFIVAVTMFTIIEREDVEPGLVALSLTYSLLITSELTAVTKASCELETNVVSLERIREYSQVCNEAPWSMPGDGDVQSHWPSAGKIEFIDYSTRYREGMDLVLNSITLSINAGEKVGIVGRTGAGKSSMVLSLFRLIEAASGRIVIDDVDISTIGLHTLRRKLTILPQDPVLFAGSLRMNLDPFDEKSDIELWQCLQHAHLKPFVQGLPDQLDQDVGESGKNLSMGQRQLVCLARTLLRKTRIFILDEATAAVDMETDELIQKTIRTEFVDCTVLTIAHRLNTIMDYDRIIVLQNGQVMEFDTPQVLLSDVTSMFYSMARNAGLVNGNSYNGHGS